MANIWCHDDLAGGVDWHLAGKKYNKQKILGEGENINYKLIKQTGNLFFNRTKILFKIYGKNNCSR
jgi:hypothetical protein